MIGAIGHRAIIPEGGDIVFTEDRSHTDIIFDLRIIAIKTNI